MERGGTAAAGEEDGENTDEEESGSGTSSPGIDGGRSSSSLSFFRRYLLAGGGDDPDDDGDGIDDETADGDDYPSRDGDDDHAIGLDLDPDPDPDRPTPESDLRRPDRSFHVVTTASLPWMTGTSVNPLLRAAHLKRRFGPSCPVTLVLPWLEQRGDRLALYGCDDEDGSEMFKCEGEQERYVREWLGNEGGMPREADEETGIRIMWYPARFHTGLQSIFAMGDICALVAPEDGSKADVCILEEPEHLHFYHVPSDPLRTWKTRFSHVVGIVHTNYKAYAGTYYHGVLTAPALGLINSLLVRAYCHRVIKLSGVLQTFAAEKEGVSNVHGIRSVFLREGFRRGGLSLPTMCASAKTDASSVVEVAAGNENDGGRMFRSLSSNILSSSKNSEAEASEGRDDLNSSTQAGDGEESTKTCVYFIGKLLWAKGLDILIELQESYRKITGDFFHIDIYGSGPEEKQIKRAFLGRESKRPYSELGLCAEVMVQSQDEAADGNFEIRATEAESKQMDEREDSLNHGCPDSNHSTDADKAKVSRGNSLKLEIDMPKSRYEWRRHPIPARFPGRRDHALLTGQYKVFVNPSISEVLCTATAEALAMGKFVVIPMHPSNAFFEQFPNCLAYSTKVEFAANLRYAITHEPTPLTFDLAYQLTWEAATERLIAAAAITNREALIRNKVGWTKSDERIAKLLYGTLTGSKGDVIRKVFGGGPVSDQVQYEKEMRERQQEADLLQ